jgi:hypothetical protein
MEEIPKFIKCDNNITVATKYIRWIYANDKEECFSLCIRQFGCYLDDDNLLKLCKKKESEAYEKYSRFFK